MEAVPDRGKRTRFFSVRFNMLMFPVTPPFSYDALSRSCQKSDLSYPNQKSCFAELMQSGMNRKKPGPFLMAQ